MLSSEKSLYVFVRFFTWIEKLLLDAAVLGRENGLSLDDLKNTLEIVYTED